MKKFITYVRETYRISWKEIFWKVWAQLKILECTECEKYFTLSEYGNCMYHTEKPKSKQSIIDVAESRYEFSCCGKAVKMIDIVKEN